MALLRFLAVLTPVCCVLPTDRGRCAALGAPAGRGDLLLVRLWALTVGPPCKQDLELRALGLGRGSESAGRIFGVID